MPTDKELEKIRKYVAERDAVVLEGNLTKLTLFVWKYNPNFRPSDESVIEIMLHKLRCAITTMPPEIQEASKKWLQERGYREGI